MNQRRPKTNGPSFGEVIQAKSAQKTTKRPRTTGTLKRRRRRTSKQQSNNNDDGVNSSFTNVAVYGTHKRPNSSHSHPIGAQGSLAQLSQPSQPSQQSMSLLSQGSGGGVSGVLPVHPDSVVMGTIEDVIMARREEQLIRQRLFMEQQTEMRHHELIEQTARLKRQQHQHHQQHFSSPQTPLREQLQGNGPFDFDANDPFATLGELGTKLNATAAMVGHGSGHSMRPDTAPQATMATMETNNHSTTRHDTFRYDSLLPAMLRGQLSPLHDVYMSSPMSVRMKSFEQGQEKLRQRNIQNRYTMDSMDNDHSRPRTSPAGTGRMFESKYNERGRINEGSGGGFNNNMEVTELREQCRMLAERVREMERAARRNNNATTATTKTSTTNRKQSKKRKSHESSSSSSSSGDTTKENITGAEVVDEEEEEEEEEEDDAGTALAFTLREINGTLGLLDGVFSAKDTNVKNQLRSRAVTVLSAWYRGFSARARFSVLLVAMRRLRRRRVRPVRKELDRVVTRREKIDDSISLFAAIRDQERRRTHLLEWRRYAANMIPIRAEWAEKAEKMQEMRLLREMRSALRAMLTVSVGPRSRKKIALRYKRRREAAREAIMDQREDRGLPRTGQIITNDMIREQMDKEATRIIHDNRDRTWKILIMTRWSEHAVEPWRKKRRIAHQHYTSNILWKYLRLWSKFLRGRSEIGRDAHGGKKKYTGRQRWQKRHNLFLIMQHHGTKMLRSHFKNWALKCHQLAGARRAFAGHMNQRCINIVRAWKIQATLSKRRKRIVIDEWKDYSIALWKVPFRAWYVWTQTRKKEQAASRILLSAWERKKLRDLKYQVFKVWRHQAAYGKIEGMFTRVRLLRTLDEQKALIKTIGGTLDVTQETLVATKTSLETQIKLNQDNVRKLEKVASEATDTEFALHNAEQEIVRLQSIIDSVGIIHPGTIKQLEMMGNNKKFDNRGLENLSRSRASYSGSNQQQQGETSGETTGKENGNSNKKEVHELVPKTAPPQIGTSNLLSTDMPIKIGKVEGKDIEGKVEEVEKAATTVTTAITTESKTGSVDPSLSTTSLPPPDAPVDSVWVKPSDAQLILRARSIHEILEEHPELQDEESDRIKLQAEQRAWNARNTKKLENEQNSQKRSKTTNHAMKFAMRIEESGTDNTLSEKVSFPRTETDMNTSIINTANNEGVVEISTNGVILNGKQVSNGAGGGPGEEYDDSVELLRLRGMLSFLLYSDIKELDKTRKLILGGQSDVVVELPSEIIRDDEDQEIEERRRNLRRLGRSGNWSSFVEDLTARFPLRHPVNLNAQDRLLIRIGDAKVRRNRNENVKRPPFNILATKGDMNLPNLKANKRRVERS